MPFGSPANLSLDPMTVGYLYPRSSEQLYRAIDQLERLQRQRAGDYVPPPVKVGVSTDV